MCVGLNPEDCSILLCYARIPNVVSLFCFRCVHLLYLILSHIIMHIHVHIQCTQSLYSCTHTVHTHINTVIEREEKSRGLPFEAERQSPDEMRRREELQQRVVEAECRAQEESRRADRAQQGVREMEGKGDGGDGEGVGGEGRGGHS